MKQMLLSAGLLLALAAFMQAQNNTPQSTTTTQAQTTTQSNNQAPSTNTTTSQTRSKNSGAGRPQDTHVTKHEKDTIVQPTNTPVKVNADVIRTTQKKLNDTGYKAGPSDGVMGPQTRAALKKFQADQKLPETGQLDQKTMAALNVGGAQELKAAPSDLGRAGKAIGHDTVGGHPVEAGKAAVTGGKDFGKKVGEGTESEAVKAKNKVSSEVSAIGGKITGTDDKTKKPSEATDQKSIDKSSSTTTTSNPPRK